MHLSRIACQAGFGKSGRQALAAYLQNRISEQFGVDIHPAAKIDKGTFIYFFDELFGMTRGLKNSLDFQFYDFCQFLKIRGKIYKNFLYKKLFKICKGAEYEPQWGAHFEVNYPVFDLRAHPCPVGPEDRTGVSTLYGGYSQDL